VEIHAAVLKFIHMDGQTDRQTSMAKPVSAFLQTVTAKEPEIS